MTPLQINVSNGDILSKGTVMTSADYTRIVGQDTPNYLVRKRKGELLPLTYFYKYRIVGEQFGSFTATYLPMPLSYVWNTYATKILEDEELLIGYLDQIDYTYYVQAAAARIYSRGWDGLTFIAELHKTAAMFQNITGRITGLLKKARFQDLWLEGRYGWRTLIYDLQDLEKAVNNIDSGRLRYKESVGEDSDGETQDSSYEAGGGYPHTVKRIATYSFGVRGTAVADLEPPRVQINPVTTAWELTRFSFVLDWVVNVGQWLEAMSYVIISRNHFEAGGQYVRVTTEIDVTNGRPLDSDYSGSCALHGGFTQEATRRIPVNVSKLPQIHVRLSLAKGVDLLALLRQAYLRRK
jgi:hypothetical protein